MAPRPDARGRPSLEARYEAALRAGRRPACPTSRPSRSATGLRDLLDDAPDGPSLSAFIEDEGTLTHLREFAIHRSPYQRKEADPHTWAIPRLSGRAKAAIVEIQADEYGSGRPGEAHADLFADTMVALGLDPTYGAYVDDVPGVTLATTNLVTFLGLHRRLRGALVGHLAAFEMTSVGPDGPLRPGASAAWASGATSSTTSTSRPTPTTRSSPPTTWPGAWPLDEPELVDEILFGAMAVTNAERRLSRPPARRRGRSGRTSLAVRVAPETVLRPQRLTPSAPLDGVDEVGLGVGVCHPVVAVLDGEAALQLGVGVPVVGRGPAASPGRRRGGPTTRGRCARPGGSGGYARRR